MSSNQRRVAFIGLGRMGLPMLRRLVAAGHPVYAHDLSSQARDRARAAGAVTPGSGPEAVRFAEVIVLMLPDSDVVTSVVDELLSADALEPGSVVVDMSSSDPSKTVLMGKRLAAAAIRLVDAPVSGGVRAALDGTLTIMTGGDDADISGLATVFAPLGRVRRAGGLGAGHAAKALNNLLSAVHLWATSEAIETGVQFGLDPNALLDIFNASSGRSGSTEVKWPSFILTETYDSGFELRLMLKDMRMAVELARSVGSQCRLGLYASELWSEAAAALEPAADHTEVAKWIKTRGDSA